LPAADGARPSRRTASAVRKGDLREQQILDVAEELLATQGYVRMTVGDIAEAAGVTRGALYFYFASKEDVLVAMVARTVARMRESAEVLDGAGSVDEVVTAAMTHTAHQWRDHGVVMRAAVDFSASVAEVDRLWTETADAFIESIANLLVRNGIPRGDGPDTAEATARALCWMVERSFYQASRVSADELERASRTCRSLWLRLVGLS
jgi:TetR/AcrR family transcriptional regulator, ethionamide resistance regulator